jgi:hypothetical protein
MSPEAPVSPAPEAKRPFYKDPFVLAFAIGVVVLTVLPFLQGRFLKAPPPLSVLPTWQLAQVADGGLVGSASLAGKVVLLEVAAGPCDAPCVERQEAFGKALNHTDDLGDTVAIVSVAMPGAVPALRGLGGGRWLVVTGEDAQLASLLAAFRSGWEGWAHTDAGTTTDELSRLPVVVVIDQLNQLRGFWHDDSTGRGNAINAARLLARRPEVTTKAPTP